MFIMFIIMCILLYISCAQKEPLQVTFVKQSVFQPNSYKNIAYSHLSGEDFSTTFQFFCSYRSEKT